VKRNPHKVVDLRTPETPEASLLAEEEQTAIAVALDRLGEPERQRLVAHEVAEQDTASLAARTGSTAGALAAHLMLATPMTTPSSSSTTATVTGRVNVVDEAADDGVSRRRREPP
jgi:hypothetical protein